MEKRSAVKGKKMNQNLQNAITLFKQEPFAGTTGKWSNALISLQSRFRPLSRSSGGAEKAGIWMVSARPQTAKTGERREKIFLSFLFTGGKKEMKENGISFLPVPVSLSWLGFFS
jgi:hypothetical protein